MIYITGDIHLDFDIDKLFDRNFKIQKKLTKKDYLIILGDVGLTWNKSDSTRYWLDWFNKRNYTTLFIDGNHENFDLLNEYPIEDMFEGRVHKLAGSVYHLMRGEVYIIDNTRFFTLGGAYSVDKDCRIEGISWWKEELPSKKELKNGLMNLYIYDNKVDYIITHECSSRIIDKIYGSDKLKIEDDVGLKDFLEFIEVNVDFRHWYFGHHHIDRTLDGKHTVIYDKIIKLI